MTPNPQRVSIRARPTPAQPLVESQRQSPGKVPQTNCNANMERVTHLVDEDDAENDHNTENDPGEEQNRRTMTGGEDDDARDTNHNTPSSLLGESSGRIREGNSGTNGSGSLKSGNTRSTNPTGIATTSSGNTTPASQAPQLPPKAQPSRPNFASMSMKNASASTSSAMGKSNGNGTNTIKNTDTSGNGAIVAGVARKVSSHSDNFQLCAQEEFRLPDFEFDVPSASSSSLLPPSSTTAETNGKTVESGNNTVQWTDRKRHSLNAAATTCAAIPNNITACSEGAGARRNLSDPQTVRDHEKKLLSKNRSLARKIKLDPKTNEYDVGVLAPAPPEDNAASSGQWGGDDSDEMDYYRNSGGVADGKHKESTAAEEEKPMMMMSARRVEREISVSSIDTPPSPQLFPSSVSRGTPTSRYSSGGSWSAGGGGGGGSASAGGLVDNTRSAGPTFSGKSSVHIFPTGIDHSSSVQGSGTGVVGGGSNVISAVPGSMLSSQNERPDNAVLSKRRKINLIIDQCETVRFPFKKKLLLENMDLAASDVPVDDICSDTLAPSLNKLSLLGNRLMNIPDKIVVSLSGLKALDLSQCELRGLPTKWNLPNLKRLNLSHNALEEFPDEIVLEGLPELRHLDMYGNKVCEIIIPRNTKLLSKLDHLNLGYNNLSQLPEDMAQLKSLRTLKVMNNVLERIPSEVCGMELRVLDVSSNPLIQPPIETCERGICSMRRYYNCLKDEEDGKRRMMEELKRKAEQRERQKYKQPKCLDKMKRKKDSVIKSIISPTRSWTKKPLLVESARSTSGPSFGGASLASTKNSGFQTLSMVHVSRSSTVPGRVGRAPVRLSDWTKSADQDAIVKKLSEENGSRRSGPPDEVIPPAPSNTDSPSEERFVSVTSRDSASEEVEPGVASKAREKMLDLKKSGESFSSQDTLPTDMDDSLHVSSKSEPDMQDADDVTVNDALKVIFVGMAMSGKTSMIRRLLDGKNAKIPKQEERTVGVDIYEWDPKNSDVGEARNIDTRIQIEDESLAKINGEVDVKFSVWDFAGQHVYHATHELFFSQRALYVLVWDMGATNHETRRRRSSLEEDHGAFKLSYDSSDDEEDNDNITDEEVRRADRALERDIDEKVQFWVDCIQSSAPGAAILPVASYDDYFDNTGGFTADEARRRCSLLKQRLQKHEDRRMQGLKQRLEEYYANNCANCEAAKRLRKLLCPFSRPKLIFGNDDEDSVVRVSCTKYSGFDRLAEKIVHIATGRERGGWDYPIFRGHVGARIPRMRLEVREVVRSMRDKFKVVEWGYFLDTLKNRGLDSVEDVSDALHFLTNIGELSYFGEVVTDNDRSVHLLGGEIFRQDDRDHAPPKLNADTDDEDEDDDEQEAVISMDETNLKDESRREDQTWGTTGLSQFVFLNPRWLVAAVACILRHDLSREIWETKRLLKMEAVSSHEKNFSRGESFYEANLNCPVITAEDACLLWQAKKFTKKAAERAQQYSNDMKITPFDFLQRLLVRFGVFVPIDLSIDKAFLGGKEYARSCCSDESLPKLEDEAELTVSEAEATPRFFFLPCLLGPGEPAEAWTYKNTDSWKTTICHSILFPDGVPPGLMERITASVLSEVYADSRGNGRRGGKHVHSTPVPQSMNRRDLHHLHSGSHEGQLRMKEILCWRTAFFLKIGMEVSTDNEDTKESIVEIFAHLVDRESHLCVAADSMGVGMRRLVLSGKGQVGDGGRKIWRGGYMLVARAIAQVISEYGGLEFEKQGICPECLAKKSVSEASVWDLTAIRAAVHQGDETVRCQYGHRVETRLISGIFDYAVNRPPKTRLLESPYQSKFNDGEPVVPVTDLLRGVVVVGLWDGKTDKVVRVGSGFIVDRKRGLIVTASHTLMNIWDKKAPFGVNYYGLREGKVVIGIIPRSRDSDKIDGTMAVFRYFAKIVAKDENIDTNGVCHLDACVLRITTRMEEDVGGDGDGCGKQPETLLLHNPDAMKKEKLHQLKVTEKCELDEQVRIIGYNQGGEGLLGPGEHLNRYVDFARGYVCMKFATGEEGKKQLRYRFKPKEEIVVICPTIGGHSGGPCVNQQGEVIGILSRADPAEKQRCYLVPTSEWKPLVKKAKNAF